jgi:hypothetical protein
MLKIKLFLLLINVHLFKFSESQTSQHLDLMKNQREQTLLGKKIKRKIMIKNPVNFT